MSQPHVVVLSRYDRQGASSRLRFLQYIPHLEAAGLRVSVRPFFDGAYLDALYAGQDTRPLLPAYYARRMRDLWWARKADVVWLEKEALPWLPWSVERRVWPRQVPVVSDYDDAVFHRYDQHASGIVRRQLGRKIDNVMRASARVFAGNRYLAARAFASGAAVIDHVPTVVDHQAYGRADASSAEPCIGWIGTPNTWNAFGVPMRPLLAQVAHERGASVRIVGAGEGHPADDRFEYVPWHESDEIKRIQGMSIGIMPLDDSAFARGKCGYKLIQYMACGLPVVASPVGVNREIVEHGVNGFLADSSDDWREALGTLLSSPELRQQMGAAGRQKVAEKYALAGYGPRVAAMLREATERRPC